MFGFEKMEVYKIAYQQHIRLLQALRNELLITSEESTTLSKRLSSFSLDSLLKFTDGYSHIAEEAKEACYTKSRSFVFASIVILKIMLEKQYISEDLYNQLYSTYESISRMMLNLIKSVRSTSSYDTRKNSTKPSPSSSHGGIDEYGSAGIGTSDIVEQNEW